MWEHKRKKIPPCPLAGSVEKNRASEVFLFCGRQTLKTLKWLCVLIESHFLVLWHFLKLVVWEGEVSQGNIEMQHVCHFKTLLKGFTVLLKNAAPNTIKSLHLNLKATFIDKLFILTYLFAFLLVIFPSKASVRVAG